MNESERRTYVPREMMKEGWTTNYPMSVENWSAERNAFTWLSIKSIEETIYMFEDWVKKDQTERHLTFVDKIKAVGKQIMYGKCHHGINTWLRQCEACDKWNEETLAYLYELKPKVAEFLKSKEYWCGLDGHRFEIEVCNLFRALGWKVIHTKGSGDDGVDIFLEGSSGKIAVQCKAHNASVGPAIARELLGAMAHFNVPKGILICTGGFTSWVYQFVKGKPIELMDLSSILRFQCSVMSQKS